MACVQDLSVGGAAGRHHPARRLAARQAGHVQHGKLGDQGEVNSRQKRKMSMNYEESCQFAMNFVYRIVSSIELLLIKYLLMS